jgi:hypothetical protein
MCAQPLKLLRCSRCQIMNVCGGKGVGRWAAVKLTHPKNLLTILLASAIESMQQLPSTVAFNTTHTITVCHLNATTYYPSRAHKPKAGNSAAHAPEEPPDHPLGKCNGVDAEARRQIGIITVGHSGGCVAKPHRVVL